MAFTVNSMKSILVYIFNSRYKNWSFFILLIYCFGCIPNSAEDNNSELGLKEYYKDYYLIGVAIPPRLLEDSSSSNLIKSQFNALTAENVMKWQVIHPSLDEYNFSSADKIVAFAEDNNMKVIGHTLVWHSQLGRGVFTPEGASDESVLVDSATLINRIKDHIFSVAARYKGRIHGWDVVNEALNDDGSLRESNFLKIAGEGYIHKAFEFAREADPNAELYYNDYNMVEPAKRQGVINLVKNLQKKGVKVDGVGVQAHWELNHPSIEEIEKSIIAYSKLGVKLMFTELDISVLPSPWRMPSADIGTRFENNATMNPYTTGIPDSVDDVLAKRYADIFALFNKHKDKITRVTFWGLHDGISWKNGFPIRGRTDYPLLFDREMKPKKAYDAVINLVIK